MNMASSRGLWAAVVVVVALVVASKVQQAESAAAAPSRVASKALMLRESDSSTLPPCPSGMKGDGWKNMVCTVGMTTGLTHVKYQDCKCNGGGTCHIGNQKGVFYHTDFNALKDGGITETNVWEVVHSMANCYLYTYIPQRYNHGAALATGLVSTHASENAAHPCQQCKQNEADCQAKHCVNWPLVDGHELINCDNGYDLLGNKWCDAWKGPMEAAAREKFQSAVDTTCPNSKNIVLNKVYTTTSSKPAYTNIVDAYGLVNSPENRVGNVHFAFKFGCCGEYKLLARFSAATGTTIPSHKKLVVGYAAGMNKKDKIVGCPTEMKWDEWAREVVAEKRFELAQKIAPKFEPSLSSEVENAVNGGGRRLLGLGQIGTSAEARRKMIASLTRRAFAGRFAAHRWNTKSATWSCMKSSKQLGEALNDACPTRIKTGINKPQWNGKSWSCSGDHAQACPVNALGGAKH